MTAVGVATVAVGVFAFEWPRHSKAIESAEAYFPEDLADYDLSSAGYDKNILHQTGFATYTSREDAEDQITIRVARNILEMFAIDVPIISLVIGEGGSGGALGIGVGDRVGILENSYYSVISPEGCAAILWKSGEKAPEAADALKLTSKDLHRLGLVDKIIPEPLGGAHRDQKGTVASVQAQLDEFGG